MATFGVVGGNSGTGVSTGPLDVVLTVGAAVNGINSTLLAFCGHDNTNGSAPTITTQAGTTGAGWVGPVETKLSAHSVQKMYLFYNLGVAAGSSTTRMVLSTGDEARMLVVAEVKGSAGKAPVTVSNDQEGPVNGTDTVLSGLLNPSASSGLLVGFSLNSDLTGTNQPTAGGGFTDDGIFCPMSGTFSAPASLRVEHLAIASSVAVQAKFSSTETTPHLTFAAFLQDVVSNSLGLDQLRTNACYRM